MYTDKEVSDGELRNPYVIRKSFKALYQA